MVSRLIRKVWIYVVVLCQLAVFIPAAQAESVPGTMEVQGYTRNYVLHIPQGYDGTDPLPLVLMLHGAGGSAEHALTHYRWDETADKGKFFVLALNALPVDLNQPPDFWTNPQVWNDGSGWGQELRPNIDDVQFVREVIASVARQYKIDRQNVFAAGFSNGASMTFRLAYEMPGQIRAIAPVAGYWNMAADTKVSQSVPTMFIIGTDDPIFPLAGGSIHMHWGNWLHSKPTKENLARWARRNGLTAEPQLVGQAGDVRLETYDTKQVFLVCYVQRLGHVWPGTVNQLPQSMMGSENISFDGTAAIWEFFQANKSQ